MDFLNKLGKKASETYQATKEKTVKFSEEMKLKGKISDAKNKINNLYQEISEKYDEISKLESDILALKDVKKCVDCGAEISKKDEFCSKCGKPQPKQEEKAEVIEESEIQDVQDAEVTEIKDTKFEDNENADDNL